MRVSATKPLVFAAVLAAGTLAAPAAQADWRGRGHHGYGYGGGAALGAIIGLGAGVAIGSAFAPPAYYAPPPVYYGLPPGYYPGPPVFYAPPPVYYAPPPYSSGRGQQVFTPHVPPAPPYDYPPQGFGPGFRK